MHQWAEERLKAAGTSGVMEVVIHDARITGQPLKTKAGIEGALTKEPSVRYDGVLAVSLNVYTPERSTTSARVDSRVSVSRELMEKATEADRKELFADMTRELVTRMDAQLSRGINDYMNNYIAR